VSQWPEIEFKDDRESCLFISTIYRKKIPSVPGSEKTEVLIRVSTRAVEKQIAKLKQTGRLERKGSRKQGYWNILK